MPALLETAVKPVMEGVFLTWLMSVSGTPQSPKPPARTVESERMSLIASAAEGTTLLISWRRTVDEKERVKKGDCKP